MRDETKMSASNLIRLGRHDRLPDRLFTHPEHNQTDAAILDRMRSRLHDTLIKADIGASDPLNRELYIQYVQEEHERLHRMVILSRQQLLTAGELTVVGFFGEKRGEANPALLQDVDTELVQEFLQHTHVLSYSSLELADGNWANMVLMLTSEGIQHWRASHKHAYAARELAPQFYHTIRLHNGVLPGGLAAPQVSLLNTKYYDFQNHGLWQAIREVSSAP
jgi:hypothetical protein